MAANDEKRIKHLEFIQLTITRMAANSFLLKAWAVTLVAAIFALSAKESNQKYFAISFIPVVMFWILDAYYVSIEKKYRKMYDKVRKTAENKIDFSLNPIPFGAWSNSWFVTLFNKTLLIFYGVIFVSLVITIRVVK